MPGSDALGRYEGVCAVPCDVARPRGRRPTCWWVVVQRRAGDRQGRRVRRPSRVCQLLVSGCQVCSESLREGAEPARFRH